MARPVGVAGPRLGRVASFDQARGLGTVVDDGASYDFHATAIADGTRRIDVGIPVAFDVVPGHCGRDEARGILRLPGHHT